MFKSGILGVAGGCLLAMSAAAQVQDDRTIDPWPGLYAGIHVGYAAGSSGGLFDANDPVGEFTFDDIEPSGMVFGAQVGYLWRLTEDIVVGVELDGSYFSESDQTGILDTRGRNPQRTNGAGYQFGEAEINWFGSLRARVGWTIDDVMPFVTAGVGAVNYDFTLEDEGGGSGGRRQPGSVSFDETVFAPVVGGGVEWAVTEDVSLRLEGLYYMTDDSISLDGTIPDADRDTGQSYEMDDLWTVRASVSFRF